MQTEELEREETTPVDVPPRPVAAPRSPDIVRPAPSAATEGRDNALLAEILEVLRTMRREQQHEDFSLGKLFGAVAQAFALCALGWAMWVIVDGGQTASGDAIVRLLFAVAFQLVALTCFANARK